MGVRIEKDSMGTIEVPDDKYWGRKVSARFGISESARKPCREKSSGHWGY